MLLLLDDDENEQFDFVFVVVDVDVNVDVDAGDGLVDIISTCTGGLLLGINKFMFAFKFFVCFYFTFEISRRQ